LGKDAPRVERDVRVISKQQLITTFGGRGGAHPSVIQLRRIALLALALGTCLAASKPTATGFNGLVSIADGDPFTIVRRDTLLSGSKGVTLLAGDIVETGPGAFLAIEVQGGNLVGIGPSTAVYFLQRGDVITLFVLKGWVKGDVRSEAMRVAGTRLGIQGHQAVMVLYADEQSDAVFDEQGSARLLLRDDAATRFDRETGANQFFHRGDRTGVESQPRPSAQFIESMPIAFRDPLPEHASASLKKLAPLLVRAVTYSDIQTWLTIPRDWRGGFIERFRARLKDPAFFAAMDEHLALHPEWTPILHPPPPPEPDRRDRSPAPEQGSEPR
jgi:hypothetical protein